MITRLTVNEGDRVRKGQVLFSLDSAQVELAVAQANAALASAKVQAESAPDAVRARSRHCASAALRPPDAFDQAKAQVEARAAWWCRPRPRCETAAHRLNNMVVTSPLAGVVTEKRMNVGENATLMPPSIVLVIQNVDMLELHARLPEMALRVCVKAAPSRRVCQPCASRDVKVKRIAPTVDPRTRTIEVVAELDNSDHRLLAGMLVEVSYGQPSKEEHAEATR